MKSAIYEGSVIHSRVSPIQHIFSYRVFMLYLDLAELPTLFNDYMFWGVSRFSLARYRRADHYGDSQTSLDLVIRKLIKKETGTTITGPIRLLTNLSYFGYCFNPVSFYYCFDESSNIQAIVSHITNTPWNEKHAYVHDCRNKPSMSKKFEFDKGFHVSPFMPMNINYSWVFSPPKDFLFVSMDSYNKDKLIFNATIKMTKKAWSNFILNKILFLSLPMSIKSTLLIYFNAFILFIKRAKFYPHP